MSEEKFPACHVDSFYGRDMHTPIKHLNDGSKWVYEGCDELLVEDNVRYKVWLKTKIVPDGIDFRSLTTVYHFEKVPEKILEMEKTVEEYWRSDKPTDL